MPGGVAGGGVESAAGEGDTAQPDDHQQQRYQRWCDDGHFQGRRSALASHPLVVHFSMGARATWVTVSVSSGTKLMAWPLTDTSRVSTSRVSATFG